MADTKQSGAAAGTAAPQQMAVLIANPQEALRQVALETDELRRKGFGEAERPGGYFIGANGKPHDANGNPIDEGKPAKGTPTTAEDIAARRAELQAELRSLDSASVAAAAASAQDAREARAEALGVDVDDLPAGGEGAGLGTEAISSRDLPGDPTVEKGGRSSRKGAAKSTRK